MVSNSITVRNPPARDYVMRATMPFPIGTDPTTLGNSLNSEQQYRQIARLAEWDIYEWCVWAPQGTTFVEISDSYQQSGPGHIRPATIIPTRHHGPRVPIEGRLVPKVILLNNPDAIKLQFEGIDGSIESLSLTGQPSRLVRSGPLKITTRHHAVTQNFMAVHWFWDITLGDPVIRLTMRFHTGIPGRDEVAFKGIRLAGTGLSGFWWNRAIKDPAMNTSNGTYQNYIIRPNDDPWKFHIFPKLMQRVVMVNMWLPNQPAPGAEDGWGVGDWSGGGFTACDLPVHAGMFSHVSNLAGQVLAEADSDNSNLENLVNSIDGHGGSAPTSFMWPNVGQQYGGPTGSDGKYKPLNGIKALAANERGGLVKHWVERLRHWSRTYTTIFEENGDPVIPENHLNGNGKANWDAYVGTGSSLLFSMQNNQGSDPYAVWKDAGFGFSAHRTYVAPGQRAYELMTCGNNQSPLPVGQRYDNWDQQHRMLSWAGDHALAWLDGDPLSIENMVLEAEASRLVYWAGAREAGYASHSIQPPSSAGVGVEWGRDTGWSMYAIAAALPFVAVNQPELTDPDNPDTSGARYGRWALGELKNFVQGADKAKMPSGVIFYGSSASFSKVWKTPPFGDGTTGNYYNQQSFEHNYCMVALRACYGALGNFWRSLLGPQLIDIPGLFVGWARGLTDLVWIEYQSITSAAIAAGQAGSGFAVNDVVHVVDDKQRSNLTAKENPQHATIRIDAVGGSGEATAISILTGGVYLQQPMSGSYQEGIGGPFVPGARTCCYVGSATVAAAGSGYGNNQLLTVDGGVPVNPNTTMLLNTITNGAGVVTGFNVARVGRYYTPPPAVATLSGGSGTGLTANLSRSCVGQGLRVDTIVWSAPFDYPIGNGLETNAFKVFSVGPYGTSTRWTTRADIVPRDLHLRTVFTDPWDNDQNNLGAQDFGCPSLEMILGFMRFSAEESGDPGHYAESLGWRYNGVTTDAAILAAIRGFGIGKWRQENLVEAWWPTLSFYGRP